MTREANIKIRRASGIPLRLTYRITTDWATRPVLALASILDGLIVFATMGFYIGGLRHEVSLWAAQRDMRRRNRQGAK